MSKGIAISSFTGGLISDLNAITTPPSVLTYAENGTLLTFNGNELVLQNDMGNTDLNNPILNPNNLIDGNKVQLSEGFIPVGVKDHGGIIYIVSHNPSSKETEIGSFPGPKFINGTPIEETPNEATSLAIENTTNTLNIGKVYQLTTSEIKPGDYFVMQVPLTMAGGNTDSVSDYDTRKFYSPRLINIDSNNRDITSKFTRQEYLNSTNPYWFLPTDLGSNLLASYIAVNKAKVYPFNLKRGRLGIRFDLEDIDSFKLTNTNNTYFPVLTAQSAGSSPAYTLTFPKFEVVELSEFKVNRIEITYKIYNNLDPTETTIIGYTKTNLFDMLDANLTKSPVDSITKITTITPNLTPTLNFTTSKNFTIEYTITAFDTRYEREFDNHIIFAKIDLSKDPNEWESLPQYAIVQKYNYPQKINGNSDQIDYFFKLNTTQTQSSVVYNDDPPIGIFTVDLNSSNKIQNINWVKPKSTEIYINSDIFIRNELDRDSDGSTFETSLHTIENALTNTQLNIITQHERNVGDTTQWVGANILTFGSTISDTERISDDTSNLINTITPYLYTSTTPFYVRLFASARTYSDTSTSFLVMLARMKEVSVQVSNSTGYNISPVIGKYQLIKGVTTPMSTFGGSLTKAHLNLNDELWPTTVWTGDAAGNIGMTSFNTTKNGFNIIGHSSGDDTLSKEINSLVKNIYYVLSFYSLGSISVTLDGDYPITKSSSNWVLNNYYFLKTTTTVSTLSFESLIGDAYIRNVSIREKLIQDSTTPEYYQDVQCYSENIDIVVSKVGGTVITKNEGIYLPYPNCNFTGFYDLDTSPGVINTQTINGTLYTIRK